MKFLCDLKTNFSVQFQTASMTLFIIVLYLISLQNIIYIHASNCIFFSNFSQGSITLYPSDVCLMHWLCNWYSIYYANKTKLNHSYIFKLSTNHLINCVIVHIWVIAWLSRSLLLRTFFVFFANCQSHPWINTAYCVQN